MELSLWCMECWLHLSRVVHGMFHKFAFLFSTEYYTMWFWFATLHLLNRVRLYFKRMRIWSILQWWNGCLVPYLSICWREWSKLSVHRIILLHWSLNIEACQCLLSLIYAQCVFSADMQRSTLEGVDWTGQKVLLQEKVLKLFWSSLAFRSFIVWYADVFLWLTVVLVVQAAKGCFYLFLFLIIFSHAFLQNLVMQHVDHSAGDLIHLLQGLLRYDPLDRLSARAALRHPFFTKDHLRQWTMECNAIGHRRHCCMLSAFIGGKTQCILPLRMQRL